MRIKFILYILTFLSFTVSAQKKNATDFLLLDYNFELPEKLLSTKSVVFISVPPSSKNLAERGDWTVIAQKAHKQFFKMGIDAIGYYFIDDINASRDATITFAKAMKKREVNNIILLNQKKAYENGSELGQFELVMTTFNGKPSFMTHGQKAWKLQNPSMKELFKVLGKEVYKSKQAKTNYLITDKPELFSDTKMLYGRRFGVNCRDLKVDKIGIAKFKKIEMPSEELQGNNSEAVKKEIAGYNAQVDLDNAKMKEIMQDYPFKYELVDASSDNEFKKLGFQYILLKMNTSGRTIRELLNYKMDYTETDYITIKATEYGTTLSSIPVNETVHKYYVRHLFTKDVYTGARWDADKTWEDALRNFIRAMKDEFKID